MIPDGITKIQAWAFCGCRARTLTIPASVSEIGAGAFRGCAFTSATIPKSVTTLGWLAFAYDSSLKTFYYGGTAAEWEAISKGSSWDVDVDMGYAITYKVHCSDQTLTFEKDLT